MKKIFIRDFEGDTFTKYDLIIFGILVPVAFVVTIGVASWLAGFLEKACN